MIRTPRQPAGFLLRSKAARRVAAVLAVTAAPLAVAQSPVLPLTFGHIVAGQTPGGTSTACGTSIPTAAGVSLPGDGCLATQATLNGPYSATVDRYGNIYIGDYNVYALRVVYNGGAALAAAIKAANPTQTFTPQVGHIYTLAGSRTGSIASSQGANGKKYYCNGTGTGDYATGSNGDACPATYAYIKPRTAAIDADGNVIFTSASGSASIRVVYVGGTAMANLIQTLNGVPAQVGYIYSIIKSSANGYDGDGQLATNGAVHTYAMRSVALDSAGNIYMSDGTNSFTAPTYASNNDVRRVDAVTGIISTYAGSPSTGANACAQGSTVGCAGVYGGDGGPATSATFNAPYSIFFDRYDNLYMADYNEGRLRVVYKAGTVPGLSNLTPGNVYTVVGGGSTAGTVANSHVPATSLSLGVTYTAGIDPAGNLYVVDGTSKLAWRVDAQTGIADVVAGNKTGTPGSPCATGSSVLATDKLGDGCPATQEALTTSGNLSFDQYGNFFETENGNSVIREFSYNTLFPTTNAGSTVTQPLAFLNTGAQVYASESFSLKGSPTSEFSDAGGPTCSLNGTIAANSTCVFNVNFTPAQAGLRSGSIILSDASAPVVTEALGGTGVAANISVDPASVTTLGTGYAPTGVATDLSGNVFFADATSGQLLKVPSGSTTPTVLASGLSSPHQVAVSGTGTVYVADTNNNRIAVVSAAGGTFSSLGTGLSKPEGVVVDQTGNVFIADTGNNRIVQMNGTTGQTTVNVSGLSSPRRLALDAAGDLYIADTGNNRVVEQPLTSEQTTVNLGTSTVTPMGLALDAAGDIYVADSVSGQVLQYAVGSTNPEALVTGLTGPQGLAVGPNGSVYVTDASASGVLAANRHNPKITFPDTNLNSSNSEQLNATNTGNAAMVFNGSSLTTATGDTAAFSITPASTSGCALGASMAPGGTCALTATFTPTAKQTYNETATFVTNAPNNGQALLTGVGVFLVSTNTALAITQPTTATINYSEAVTVTATVTPATSLSTAPSGTVTFSVDGKKQTPQSVPANGVVSLTLNPAVGVHAITVSYSGDSFYASSSNSLSFTVQQAVTTTTLAITPTSSGANPILSLKATVNSTTATGETGTVSFYAGTQLLGTSTVTNGSATLVTTGVVFSSYAFKAVYSGDVNFAGSTSSAAAPSPQFFLLTSTAVSVPQAGVGTLPVTIAPLYNYTGTITATCSNLPVNTLCRFNPASMTFAAGSTAPQVYTVYFYTNVAPDLAGSAAANARGWLALMAWIPVGLVAMLAVRRKRFGSLRRMAVLALLVAGAGAFTGCSSGTGDSTAKYVTPTGTSTVTVTFADGAGFKQTVNVTLTVLGPYQLP